MIHYRKQISFIFMLVVALAGCRSNDQSEATLGYHGPYPSGLAQQALTSCQGMVFHDLKNDLGGGDWIITDGFAVIPNSVSPSGKGPVLTLKCEELIRYIPMETDGDTADFYSLIHDRKPAGVDGVTSETYLQTMKSRKNP